MQNSTICFVEDDVLLAEMYSIKLEAAGYAVRFCSNGRSFLESIGGCSPELVILDIIMPELNGFQVLKELRKNVRTRRLPVIILTNLTQADVNLTDSLSRSLGIIDYLLKSKTTPAQLLARVSWALGQSQPI